MINLNGRSHNQAHDPLHNEAVHVARDDQIEAARRRERLDQASNQLGEPALIAEVQPLTDELSIEALQQQADDVELDTMFTSRYYKDSGK